MSLNADTAEPSLIRSNKLDLVERVADDLAHEIKNPLHSMVINLEVLKRRIARSEGSPPEELLRYVGVIAGELERVNQRIDMLLRMVRPARGGEPTSLAEALEELVALTELDRERGRVALDFDAATVPMRPTLPRDLGRQLLLNLLLEALDGVGSGGTLAIRAGERGGEVELRISGRADHPVALPSSSRLEAARVLAEEAGARLEVQAAPGADHDGSPYGFAILLLLRGGPAI